MQCNSVGGCDHYVRINWTFDFRFTEEITNKKISSFENLRGNVVMSVPFLLVALANIRFHKLDYLVVRIMISLHLEESRTEHE